MKVCFEASLQNHFGKFQTFIQTVSWFNYFEDLNKLLMLFLRFSFLLELDLGADKTLLSRAATLSTLSLGLWSEAWFWFCCCFKLEIEPMKKTSSFKGPMKSKGDMVSSGGISNSSLQSVTWMGGRFGEGCCATMGLLWGLLLGLGSLLLASISSTELEFRPKRKREKNKGRTKTRPKPKKF